MPKCTLFEIQAQIDNEFLQCHTFQIMRRQAKSYSIVDHELLHGGYLGRLTHHALVLYLFLVVVGDREGKNFYSDSLISRILRMDILAVFNAREELLKEGLIDYKRPYWRILTLTYPKRCEENNTALCINSLVRHVLEKNRRC